MYKLPEIDQGHVEGIFTGAMLREMGPDLTRAALLEMRQGFEMEKIQAACRQKQVASQENMLAHRMIDEIGQLKLRVDMTSYLYWEMRKPGCWEDKQFRAEFWRDNPECRVNTITKARVVGGVKDMRLGGDGKWRVSGATVSGKRCDGGGLVVASKYARVDEVRRGQSAELRAGKQNLEVVVA